MLRIPEQFVLAKCGDLALARECIADLRSAGFRGTSEIIRRQTHDNLHLGSGAYGTVTGAAIAQGLMVGSVTGALLAGLLVALLPRSIASSSINVAVVSTSIGLGALVGGLLRLRLIKNSSLDSAAQRDRFLVRFKGEPAELAKAFDVLSTSACHAVNYEEEKDALEPSSLAIQAGSGEARSALSHSVE